MGLGVAVTYTSEEEGTNVSESEAAGGNYVFNENGNYVRTDKNTGVSKLVIEHSATKSTAEYFFNDIVHDVENIEYYIKTYGANVFKQYKYIYNMSDNSIYDLMDNSDVPEDVGFFERYLKAAAYSNAGKYDFTAVLASRIQDAQVPKNPGDLQKKGNFLETELYEHPPLYIIGSHKTVFNLPDAGNFLWSFALTRMGFGLQSIQNIAAGYNKYKYSLDPSADTRAHTAGNAYYKIIKK